jgi:hypothetical protein
MTMIEGRFTFEWPSLSARSSLRSSVNRMVNGSARTALILIVSLSWRAFPSDHPIAISCCSAKVMLASMSRSNGQPVPRWDRLR